MAGIIERLNADIAAYNAQPIEEPWRTDLHALFLDIVAGLDREEWTRDDLIELLDHAAVIVAQRRPARE
jgi:hypothetical protein